MFQNKKLFVYFAIVAVLLMAVPAAFAQSGYPQSGVAITNAVIQNTSNSTAIVLVQYYSTTGNPEYTRPGVQINSGSVKEIATVNEPLPGGFNGTAVVSGDQSIAAIVSIKYSGVPNDPDGKTQGAYNGFSEGANTIYFPSLWRYSNTVSTFTVMNTENAPATVSVKYYSRTGTLLDTRSATLPAFAGRTWDLSNSADVPSSLDPDGSVTVESTSKLAGASTATYDSRSAAYQALTDNNRGQVLYAPSHYRYKASLSQSKYTLFSALNIQNTSATNAVNIEAKYYNRSDSALALTVQRTIPAGSAVGLNTKAGDFAGLGDQWDGSVEVRSLDSSIDIVGTLVTQWGQSDKAGILALTTENEASNKLFFPAQYRLQGSVWNQWSSVNVQNVGSTAVSRNDITVTYVDTNGATIATFTGSQLADLAPGGAFGLNTRNDIFSAAGTSFIGGAVVEGPAGSKLIGTSNIIYKDRASAYNAFSD